MRNSVICLSSILIFSSTAFAGLCENAVRGAERKAATAKGRCEDNTTINRLKSRLTTAKTEKAKANLQKQITNATTKQQKYCTQATTHQATAEKIKGFCSIASSANTSYCRFGYSLRIRNAEASSRCKRGRMWFPEQEKCYYVEEYYYTSNSDFGNGKGSGRGEILYSGQAPGTNFYQINTGFLLENVKQEADCR